jgi:hypothetical protein
MPNVIFAMCHDKTHNAVMENVVILGVVVPTEEQHSVIAKKIFATNYPNYKADVKFQWPKAKLAINQGILKGKVSLYQWPPFWLGLELAVWQLTIFVFICKTD